MNAWEKRKVSDYLCESRIPGSNGLKAKKLTVKLWGKGVVPKNETYSGSIKTKYYVRSANQLIYGKLDFLHAAFGIVPQSLDGWESTIDSPAFDVNTSIGNAAFLLALFLKPNFYLREGIRANGSRKAKRIHEDTFLSMSISAPQRKEQNQIAMVLDKTEFLIAATQHKIDALEQVKKALLQRLFDQSWRFDGYLETWKKYRLGDHAEILTGGTPKTSVAEYWEPKSIPWMSSGEVNKVYLDQTDTMISLEGFKNSSARWIKKHSILIALAGQGKTRGTVAVNNIALTTNQSIAAIIPGKDLYYEFVFQNLTNRYNELRLISSGDGTRGGLNKQIVSDVTIHSPNLNEQIRIGKLLSKVDHLSTENQLKLSRIELIKKYLLQTLFI
ncbi:restriction endonuclease subunit S [Lacticaseibacillus paracasei]|uniref:restriction endonuclease subunit S n=1 Tax=Lacticaseibacillus paracasei TaxID=1597 RepID=UPI0021C35C5C|nr:restriction endonuclease subunit S [Lacticaseibacillus paracasei]MCP9347490.1 restriction endonuclease subunit S [Lacticaseibacillus paracasei]MCP9367083.1 restriction endonuclease subunit S [Lacticaseibacillus paracasei]